MTVDMIALFADLFGEYPFLDEKYGHAEFLWGGGMEHQTITSLGSVERVPHRPRARPPVVGRHGDVRRFPPHLAERGVRHVLRGALVGVHVRSGAVPRGHAVRQVLRPRARSTSPTPSDWNRIFHTGLSYNKGSWVLHMLRHVVGDADFFQILQDLLRRLPVPVRHGDDRAVPRPLRRRLRDGPRLVFPRVDLRGILPDVRVRLAVVAERRSLRRAASRSTSSRRTSSSRCRSTSRSPPRRATSRFVAWDSLATQTSRSRRGRAHWRKARRGRVDPENGRGADSEPDVRPRDPRRERRGLHHQSTTTEIWSAYSDSVFWGAYDISFWDCFDETAYGYPANMPPPLGHGIGPARHAQAVLDRDLGRQQLQRRSRQVERHGDPLLPRGGRKRATSSRGSVRISSTTPLRELPGDHVEGDRHRVRSTTASLRTRASSA